MDVARPSRSRAAALRSLEAFPDRVDVPLFLIQKPTVLRALTWEEVLQLSLVGLPREQRRPESRCEVAVAAARPLS